MMSAPNPRDRHWRLVPTPGQVLKDAAAMVAIAYGVASAVVLTALLASAGPGPVMTGGAKQPGWRTVR